MESHKRFYKAAHPLPSLTERVKKDRNRQNLTRKDKFNANRKIEVDLDDSASTQAEPSPQKLSSIRDRSTRLRTYIEQKRTAKLKEKFEERPAFIPYVPVGRWVEKPEPVHKPKAFTITTPVRKALMNDGKIFKKSTIKQIAQATTTIKKENAGPLPRKTVKGSVKSKRKILAQSNVTEPTSQQQDDDHVQIALKEHASERIPSLNDTFELITDDLIQDDSAFEAPLEKREPSPSPPPPPPPTLPTVPAAVEAVKVVPIVKEEKREVKKQPSRARIVVPVKPMQRTKITEKQEPQPKRKTVMQLKSVKSEKGAEKRVKKSSPKSMSVEINEPQLPAAEPVKKILSHTYKFYSSSLKNQIAYIKIQIQDIVENTENFVENLPADTQALVYQAIQQADILVKDKFKSFEEVLEKFEAADDSKHITEDDVENYWSLLYDHIQTFKDNLNVIREAKKNASKKRRTTRVHTLVETTPSRRSRRIADNGDTPKHSASCFGCTPLSSSRVNTPKSAKSAKKRRTTFKKSIAFDQV